MITSIHIMDASPQSSVTYQYELRGNLIKETGLTGDVTYQYNQQNQLVKMVDETGEESVTTTYRYDKNGSLVEKAEADEIWNYKYDSRGNLAEGNNSLQETSRYTYNALGVRIGHDEICINENAGHQNISYAPGSRQDEQPLDSIVREGRFDHQRIWETIYSTVVQNNMETVSRNYFTDYTSAANRDIFIEEKGSYVQYYVYDGGLTPVNVTVEYAQGTKRGEAGENPGSDIADGTTIRGYFHQGLLGSNLYVTTEDGQILTHMIYDEWGLPLNETRYDMNYHGLDNINNFTGYSYDEVLGFYYAQARMYDPKTRRFTAEDPAKDGLNWYRYAENNPGVYVDVEGLKVWLIHGTFSNEKTWSEDVQDYFENLYNDIVETPEWSGGNSVSARSNGAEDIYNEIKEALALNPNEPIRLVGHSHGGNVAILVANRLRAEGITVDMLVTIATPVRSDYQLTEDRPDYHYHLYNTYDGVQILGGSVENNLSASRTFGRNLKDESQSTVNIKVEKDDLSSTGITASHSAMHTSVDVLKKYLEPYIKPKTKGSRGSVK